MPNLRPSVLLFLAALRARPISPTMAFVRLHGINMIREQLTNDGSMEKTKRTK